MGEVDHVRAVVEPGHTRTGRERVAQQQTAAAAQLQQAVGWPEREDVENRPAREVVHILPAVHLPRPSAAWPARDPVGQPAVERLIGESAVLPCRKVVDAEAELAQHLRVTVSIAATHDGPIVLARGPRDWTPSLSECLINAADRVSARVPVTFDASAGLAFQACERVQLLERPAATVALVGWQSGWRLCVGAAGYLPVWRDAASLAELDADELAAAVEPIEDTAGSAEYKRHLVSVLTYRVLASARRTAR